MLMPEHYSEEELRQWGRNENVARIRDLREHPEHAKARAGLRRNYASLTAAQAAWAVGQAQKEIAGGRPYEVVNGVVVEPLSDRYPKW